MRELRECRRSIAQNCNPCPTAADLPGTAGKTLHSSATADAPASLRLLAFLHSQPVRVVRMNQQYFYPVGTLGQPWGAAEKAQWLARQQRQRSHAEEVVAPMRALAGVWDVVEYGALDYAGEHFPLLALRSRGWDEELPVALVTGGVHGYETSGVLGALLFARRSEVHTSELQSRENLVCRLLLEKK